MMVPACRAGGVLKVGNRTECALLQLTESLGVSYAEVREAAAPRVMRQFPFSSDRKRMSTLLEGRGGDGGQAAPARLHLKGAAELVLDLCTTRLKLDESVQVRTRDQPERSQRSFSTMKALWSGAGWTATLHPCSR